jgi:hypothetical protein
MLEKGMSIDPFSLNLRLRLVARLVSGRAYTLYTQTPCLVLNLPTLGLLDFIENFYKQKKEKKKRAKEKRTKKKVLKFGTM